MSEAGPIRGMDCAEEIETVEASQLDGRMGINRLERQEAAIRLQVDS